jgi:hypothetical protein
VTGWDATKQLTLAGLITFVAGCGLLLIPTEAFYLKAGYAAAWAIAIGGYLLFAKPNSEWVRGALIFLSAGFAVIAAGTVLSA